jgi:uncharacterized membrane protein
MSEFIADWLLYGLNLAGLGFMVLILLRAPWALVLEVPLRQHLVFGSCLALIGFWCMNFAVNKVIALHPLIITSVALMIGFRLSCVVGAFATLGYMILAGYPLNNWGMHWWVNVVVPAACIVGLNQWMRKRNPHNLFFYTLGVGFLGAGLTVPIATALTLLIATLSELDWSIAFKSIEPSWILLAMFPEAFINGMIVSSITVFFPDWMKTFDEEYFLSR